MKKSKLTHGLAKAMTFSFCTLLTAASFFSCDSDKMGSGRSGQLRLSLVTDTTSLKKGVSGSTRATSLEDEFLQFLTISDYKINIVQGETTIKTFARFDLMPAEVELKEGTYTLIASKGDNLPSSFENPYFEGSTDFTVKAEMSTPLSVTCTLGNTRIMVDYTEDFKKQYSDYTTLLKTSFVESNVEVKGGETRPLYLQVDKKGTELKIFIRLKKVGETKDKTYEVPTSITLERRQNIRLVFKTDGSSNGIGLDIQLDDELEEIDFWPELPGFMLPDSK